MPGWVEDPSLGNIMMDTYNGLQAAPGKALNNMATADEIKRKRYQDELDRKAIESFTLPDAYAPPIVTAKDMPGPWSPDDPRTAMPMATNMTGMPTQNIRTETPDVELLKRRQAEREFAMQNARQRIYATHGEAGMNALGMGRVAARGPGDTAADRIQDQFYTTGKYPTAEERAPNPVNNFLIPNPQGGDPIMVSSQDNKTIFGSGGVPLPPNALHAGPASQTASNPMESAATAAKELEIIENRRVQRGYLTDAEATRIPRLLDVVSPFTRKVETDPGGQLVEKQVRDRVLPPWMVNLDALGQEYAAGMARPGPGYTPAPVPQVPQLSGGGLGANFDPMALDKAAVVEAKLPTAPAPSPAPFVPTDPNTSREISRGPINAVELRKEIIATQEYKDYVTAVPSYNTVVEAASMPPTNATDLNVIYGIAKLFDPGSVVREGELKLAASTGTMGQQLAALYSRLYNDKGLMDKETRANLIEQAYVRMNEYKQNKDVTAGYYSKIAQKGNLDPATAIPPVPEMKPFNKATILKAAEAVTTGGPSTARPGARTRPKTADEILQGK